MAGPEATLSAPAMPSEDEEIETGTLISRSVRTAPTPTFSHYAVLLSVPVLWGTFTPSMKLLLDHKHAPPVLLTNLLSHTVGTLALALLWLCEALPRKRCLPKETGPAHRWRSLRASCELGVYLFFGQLTQLLGLNGTSATSNAILVQSSVVIVPLFEAIRQQRDERGHRSASGVVTASDASGERAEGDARHGGAPTWFRRCLPSLLALGGIASITVAPQLLSATSGGGGRRLEAATAVEEEAETLFGVMCSLASAGFYALHTVRLSEYCDVDPTVQATGQVAVNAVLDLLATPVAALAAGVSSSPSPLRWLRKAPPTALHRLMEAAAWNGVVVVGATTWGMSYAQQGVRASTAVVTYAMEPLFATVYAAAFLHESIGPLLLLGGGLIIAANVIAGLRMRAGE